MVYNVVSYDILWYGIGMAQYMMVSQSYTMLCYVMVSFCMGWNDMLRCGILWYAATLFRMVCSIMVIAYVSMSGVHGVHMDVWYSIKGRNIINLEQDKRYPNQPDVTKTIEDMASPLNLGDNYGLRLRAYFVVSILILQASWIVHRVRIDKVAYFEL